jgi:putative colanic acid biosysnthesis UDP-glucose lipid carrier transferase
MDTATNPTTQRATVTASRHVIDNLRHRRVRMGSAHSPLATLLHGAFKPSMAALSLLLLLKLVGEPLSFVYPALGIMAFIISSQLLTELPHRGSAPPLRWALQALPRLGFEWIGVVALVLFIGFAMHVQELYSLKLVLAWFFSAPALILLLEMAKVHITRAISGNPSQRLKHVVVGANELAMELNRRTASIGASMFVGYFDDRSTEQLPEACHAQLLGRLGDAVAFVQQNGIDSIYISLPVAGNERVRELIHQLRDTTASVFVLPDILTFDTIQARVVEIDGLPAVSIYDTPFDGTRGIAKRCIDAVLAVIALLMIWPVLAAIAIGIKFSSPGPVLFKQRRYGLHGEQIEVYKFRSMTVCENGASVTQATRFDKRVTRFGKFLRASSLDELPQIINVLEGKMSLVGPRPHAVAHNEQYRKLIDGYMFRHKVRPGITGWAQVNGLRGETETVDKMRKRVEYDLDYLRHWSLWLDVKIVFKTIRLMFGDAKAY